MSDNNKYKKNKSNWVAFFSLVAVATQSMIAGIKLAAVLESLFSSPDNRVVTTPSSSVVKITAEDAGKYIGKRVTVCSKVYGVKELPNINFINLGARFPDSPLTIVVFPEDKANFKDGLTGYD